MAAAPIGFQLHGLAACALFALWPFTRLVHVFSAPLGYLTRPYIVYRSRDDQLGSRRPGAGGSGSSEHRSRPRGEPGGRRVAARRPRPRCWSRRARTTPAEPRGRSSPVPPCGPR